MPASQSHVRGQAAWVVWTDLVCLLLSGVLAVAIRMREVGMGSYLAEHTDGLILFVASVFLANYLAGSYRLQHAFSRFNLVVIWFFSLSVALIVLSVTSYAWFRMLLGRGVLGLWLGFYGGLSLLTKLVVYRALFQTSMFECRTAIIGSGRRAEELRQILESPFVLPSHKVVAFVNVTHGADGQQVHGEAAADGLLTLESTPAALLQAVHRLGVSLVVVGLDNPAQAKPYQAQLRRLRFEGVEVLLPLSVYQLYTGRTPLDLVTEDTLNRFSMESDMPMVRRLKRIMDVLITIVVGVVLLPLALGIAVLVKLSSPRGPVFYIQRRVGQFGKTFRIIKFRTMREDAEKETGPVWSAANDSRVTRLGRILRRFRLDELPQLVNVLKGEMSLVGPRPERPSISAELVTQIPFFEERENAVPGLTGWAQIRHPYGNTLEDAIRKLEYDLYYIRHVSLSLDLQIILSTMRIVALGKERAI